MQRLTIIVLKVVIAVALAGSLVVQFGLLPVVWADMSSAGEALWGRIALVVIVGLGVLTMQIFAVCVWRLLTLVHKDAVFSPVSFRYVNMMAATFTSAAVLALSLAVLLAPGDIAPGVVGLLCGAGLVLAGIALLVVVMRRLLVQAITFQADARHLRTELDGVI